MKRLYGDKMIEWNPEPTGDQTWWMRSHCGPGSTDGDGSCECGRTHEKCARNEMYFMAENFKQSCGCSGFWCYKCGLFYPQDACYDQYDEEYETFSGKKVSLKGNYIHCHCGAKLFKKSQFNGDK